MSNLTGSRSRFKQDTNFELDQIVELYDIPTSKRKLVSEYQVLLSKDNPSSTELERLSILQNELSE